METKNWLDDEDCRRITKENVEQDNQRFLPINKWAMEPKLLFCCNNKDDELIEETDDKLKNGGILWSSKWTNRSRWTWKTIV